MALEATHMRFALDLKDKYQVKNIEKYIAGSIYPDSRYVTGIDRDLTHSDELLISLFAKDDFYKGWHCHLLVDDAQTQMMKKYFSDYLPIFSSENRFVKKEWKIFSALKVLQDMDDIAKFDLQKCVMYLENYTFNPNNEKLEDIKKYNQIMIDLYKNKTSTSIDDNVAMWVKLTGDKNVGVEIKKELEILQQDVNVIKNIKTLYQNTLEKIENSLL